MTQAPEPRPSASVILLRDGANAVEVLLVRRNETMVSHGGSWVFPGGKVDPADGPGNGDDPLETARRAAVREVREETGIHVSPEALRPFAHWTTPVIRPKRFANWFFVAPLTGDVAVRVDGSEIIDYRWTAAERALEARDREEIVLPPPTFVTLHMLRSVENLAQLPAFFERHSIQRFNPKIVTHPDGEVALYEGDAGYDAVDLELSGPRHRLTMLAPSWRYDRKS